MIPNGNFTVYILLNIIPEHEHSATDMLSDWVQAKKAVLWDLRADGMTPQLQSRGLTIEELEELLLNLAADVHEKRTRQRAGAVILEAGVINQLYRSIYIEEKRTIRSEQREALLHNLNELITKRCLY